MRRVAVLTAAAVLLIAVAVAKRPRTAVTPYPTIEESVHLTSSVRTADPQQAFQLTRGFHDIEQGAWRWAAGRFSVVLRPPRRAGRLGAVLTVEFALPEPVMQRLHAVTLTGRVAGTTLEPETYRTVGSHVYQRKLSPSLMRSERVNVEFQLDKYLPAGTVDGRELGCVVSAVRLETAEAPDVETQAKPVTP